MTPANSYANSFANISVDTIDANRIVARFAFEVYSSGGIPDTILISDGSFRVAR